VKRNLRQADQLISGFDSFYRQEKGLGKVFKGGQKTRAKGIDKGNQTTVTQWPGERTKKQMLVGQNSQKERESGNNVGQKGEKRELEGNIGGSMRTPSKAR